MLSLSAPLSSKMSACCSAAARHLDSRKVGPSASGVRGEPRVPAHTARLTLVLAAVHPILGGVVVLGQAAALGGVWLIWDVLVVLLGWRHSRLLWLLAVSQRFQHRQVIEILLRMCVLGQSSTSALWKKKTANDTVVSRGGGGGCELKMIPSHIICTGMDEVWSTGSPATWTHWSGNEWFIWLSIRFLPTSQLHSSLDAVRLCNLGRCWR